MPLSTKCSEMALTCDMLKMNIHIGTCVEHCNVLLWGQAINEIDHLHNHAVEKIVLFS